VWTEFDDLGSYLGVRTPEVEEAMRTAAQEWLAIHDSSPDTWRAYYEQWRERIGALAAPHRKR
jgi:hypothetical protein